MHAGENPFLCEFCDTGHMRIHTTETLFTCEVCDKSLTSIVLAAEPHPINQFYREWQSSPDTLATTLQRVTPAYPYGIKPVDVLPM